MVKDGSYLHEFVATMVYIVLAHASYSTLMLMQTTLIKYNRAHTHTHTIKKGTWEEFLGEGKKEENVMIKEHFIYIK